ncbi:MAG: hypothetical protein HKN47_07730 [Pirellulaceae bacterium]|nr:hypothetical protein [Pirellulaceae bacterium]
MIPEQRERLVESIKRNLNEAMKMADELDDAPRRPHGSYHAPLMLEDALGRVRSLLRDLFRTEDAVVDTATDDIRQRLTQLRQRLRRGVDQTLDLTSSADDADFSGEELAGDVEELAKRFGSYNAEFNTLTSQNVAPPHHNVHH